MEKTQKQPHILLVEDDPFLSDIYKKKFEMEGFKVSLARDGEKAVNDANKKSPDLILLDVLLPKLDGFAVLEKLKSDKKTKNIPVVLLTNFGQKEDVEKGMKAGAVEYLIKTHFKPSEIVDKIKKVLKL
ncbi:MAG: response regulator transcription factor [Patescibacteria group bacterium]